MATFQLFFFLVQGTGGSTTGPDPQNRVGDHETGSRGRPVSSGLQVPGEPGHCRARTRPLGATAVTNRRPQLTALHLGRTLIPRKFLGTYFCYTLSEPQGYRFRTEGGGQLKICNDPNGNRTGNLSFRSAGTYNMKL